MSESIRTVSSSSETSAPDSTDLLFVEWKSRREHAPTKVKPETMTPPADEVKPEHQDKKRKVDPEPQKLWMESRPIELIAGHDGHEKPFFIHRKLLAAHSGWFSKLLKDDGDAPKEPVRVNARPELFTIYFEWLYQGMGAIDYSNLHTAQTRSPALLCRTMHWLWLLGQAMDSERFQNTLLDMMHHTFYNQHLANCRLPRLALHPDFFKDATPTANQELYRLYLDVVVNHGAGCPKHLAGQPSDFLAVHRSSIALGVLADIACQFERNRDPVAALGGCFVARTHCDRFHRHLHTPPCYFARPQ